GGIRTPNPLSIDQSHPICEPSAFGLAASVIMMMQPLCRLGIGLRIGRPEDRPTYGCTTF
ncbi:MAG: hypothetical protein R3C05_28560, partial [Pirellulaceae bacterium]